MPKRDVTRALKLIRSIMRHGLPLRSHDRAKELEQILVDMDARTGKRDPTKRRQSATNTFEENRAIATGVPLPKQSKIHPGSASHVDGHEPSSGVARKSSRRRSVSAGSLGVFEKHHPGAMIEFFDDMD